MHVFQVESIRDVIDTSGISIALETFESYQGVYFTFCHKPLTLDIGLCEDDTEQTVFITSKSNDTHDCLREEVVVERNGFKRTS